MFNIYHPNYNSPNFAWKPFFTSRCNNVYLKGQLTDPRV